MVLVRNAQITKKFKVMEGNVHLIDALSFRSCSLTEPVRHVLNIQSQLSMASRRLPLRLNYYQYVNIVS